MPEDLKEQVKKFVPQIDLMQIKDLIDSMELSKTQKEFYFKTIKIRKELFLDKALKSILKD